LAERLVRAIVIKVVAEAVKPHLLLGRRGGRRARGLRLERGKLLELQAGRVIVIRSISAETLLDELSEPAIAADG